MKSAIRNPQSAIRNPQPTEGAPRSSAAKAGELTEGNPKLLFSCISGMVIAPLWFV